jgi:hypothetical protein
LKEDNLFMVIDESALVSCFKRDATSELLKIVRESNEPDGGLQVLEVQDLMQGEPFHSEAEKAAATVNGVMLKELNVEGEFMSDPNREIVFLHESNRFTGPLKETYEQGANELRGGGTGAKVQEMMRIAVARNFTPEEDVDRVAKRVVLGMNSWQTRVFASKKEVDKKRLARPPEPFQPIAMEAAASEAARQPRPCVRCVTRSIERASEFA